VCGSLMRAIMVAFQTARHGHWEKVVHKQRAAKKRKKSSTSIKTDYFSSEKINFHIFLSFFRPVPLLFLIMAKIVKK
jgi:hypothetical protein